LSYSHSCKAAGAGACGFTARAGSEAELRSILEQHVRSKHKVERLTDTIYNYLRAVSGGR
jgi:predicted small metal-binding protein